MRIKKVCEFCNSPFVAKQQRTKYCSLACAQRGHKRKLRDEKLGETNQVVMEKLHTPAISIDAPAVDKALVGTKELAMHLGISERSISRLIKDPDFPQIRIGKRLLFQKDIVLIYIINKYGNP